MRRAMVGVFAAAAVMASASSAAADGGHTVNVSTDPYAHCTVASTKAAYVAGEATNFTVACQVEAGENAVMADRQASFIVRRFWDTGQDNTGSSCGKNTPTPWVQVRPQLWKCSMSTAGHGSKPYTIGTPVATNGQWNVGQTPQKNWSVANALYVTATYEEPAHWFAGGSGPTPPVDVQTPAAVCRREWLQQDGKSMVRITASVANQQAGTVDVMKVRTEWGTEGWVSAGSIIRELPALTSMPADGWRGYCQVTRTVTDMTTHRGSLAWQAYSEQRTDVGPDDTGVYRGFVAPPTGVPTMPWIISTPKPMPIGTPIGANVPTIAGVAAAAIIGWEVGGYIGGKLSPEGANEWYCRWNAGFRVANPSECAVYDETPELRTQTQLKDANGNNVTTATATPWQTAVAVAEVLIDPSPRKAELGTQTVVATEAPTLTPEETQQLEADVGEEPGADNECKQSVWAMLNPFNIAETMGCVLVRLFVPSQEAVTQTQTELQEAYEGRVPFTVETELSESVGELYAAADAGVGGEACPSVDFTPAIPFREQIGIEDEALLVRAPTPTGSGCVGAGGVAGDVAGYRVLFRNVLTALLWLIVLLRLSGYVGPKERIVELGP